MMKECAVLILAAGKGTRMKSSLCKVLHPVAGRPMLRYVIDAVHSAGLENIAIVVGHQADDVEKDAQGAGIRFAVQEPQLGTGHAVAAARDLFDGFGGNLLVLCGDIPLLSADTIRGFINFHEDKGSRATVLTTHRENPYGYGRIVRNGPETIARIVEERDGNEAERALREINTGVYIFDCQLLYRLLNRIQPNNAQGEYYLTDVIAEVAAESIPVHAFVLENPLEAAGINSRAELAAASAVLWNQRRKDLMDSGVTLLDPSTFYVDAGVIVGPDTVIHPCVTLSGATEIGKDCTIESGVSISDSRIGNGVSVLLGSRLDRVVVEDFSSIGPMAHLRPETRIGKRARIGNFVEVKKTDVGDGTKAAHLTYLGDSVVGKDVNIGCGTITCNYDGRKKHPTIIHDKCFIGSDVQFVAPVVIGEGSVIGAGSTITKDVPDGSLSVARSKQRIYPLRKGQGMGEKDEDRKP